MTQRSRITPSGWLAIALAAYIILFGLAYEFFRNRAQTDVASPVTTDISTDLSGNSTSTLPSIDATTGLTTGGINLPGSNATNALNPLEMGYRAAIDFPANGTVVQTPDGWVDVRGRLSTVSPDERLFLVLESPSSNPPIIYPQQEIIPSDSGNWAARVRFGSAGQSYRTYIISTTDATAVSALFSHEALAGLPNGFEIVSNVSVNSMQ